MGILGVNDVVHYVLLLCGMSRCELFSLYSTLLAFFFCSALCTFAVRSLRLQNLLVRVLLFCRASWHFDFSPFLHITSCFNSFLEGTLFCTACCSDLSVALIFQCACVVCTLFCPTSPGSPSVLTFWHRPLRFGPYSVLVLMLHDRSERYLMYHPLQWLL